jgi:hypothetical protein
MVNFATASAADHAETLLIARRSKNLLVLLILLILLFQLGLFFAARYKVDLTTSPNLDFLKYLVGLTNFLGVALPVVLMFFLELMVLVLLLRRLIGVSQMLMAFTGCLVLIVLLFPWQAFLRNQTFTSEEFKIPGVLYTWAELLLRARSRPDKPALAMLFWARFVAWPVVAILVTLRVQMTSSKSLSAALREDIAEDAAAIAPVAVIQPPANL